MSDDKWLVRINDANPVGPVTTDQLRRGVEAGKVPPEAVVQQVGSSEPWRPVSEVLAEATTPRTTSCPDCGGTVSKRAQSCPHCGGPLQRQGAVAPVEPATPEPRSSSDVDEADPLDDMKRYESRRRKKVVIAIAALGAVVGICFVVAAALKKEDPCVHKAGCLQHGECSTVIDRNGQAKKEDHGARMCRSASKSHCEQSQWCDNHGFCSFVPFKNNRKYGTCAVATDKDCTSSFNCRSNGYCTPGRGHRCMGSNILGDVRQLVMGKVLYGGVATCCTK